MEGNQMKMREALVEISKFADDWQSYANTTKAGALDSIYELANFSLSSPPRNCDVGTAEEQIKRHKEWCDRNICMFTYSCRVCYAKWAQMPYEVEKGGTGK